MQGKIRANIKDLLKKVEKNKTGVFSKTPVLVAVLNKEISDIVGDELVHISEFVIAKIKGLIPDLDGHREITDSIFTSIQKSLDEPLYIYLDTRTGSRRKFLFVAEKPLHLLVVEVVRPETGVTEINSVFPLGNRTLKQFGSKFRTVYSHSH